MPTTVISVRGRDRAALLANPDFVYVGRAAHRQGWRASPFGNPFRASDCGRTDDGSGQWHAARLFELRLIEGLSGDTIRVSTDERERAFREIARRLPELRGKTLGCWCGSWRPGEPEIACHAVTLAKLADADGASPRED